MPEIQAYTVLATGEPHAIAPENINLHALHSENVYVIVQEDPPRIYLWKGKDARLQKRFHGVKCCQQLREKLAGTPVIVTVNEGEEPEEFFEIPGGRGEPERPPATLPVKQIPVPVVISRPKPETMQPLPPRDDGSEEEESMGPVPGPAQQVDFLLAVAEQSVDVQDYPEALRQLHNILKLCRRENLAEWIQRLERRVAEVETLQAEHAAALQAGTRARAAITRLLDEAKTHAAREAFARAFEGIDAARTRAKDLGDGDLLDIVARTGREIQLRREDHERRQQQRAFDETLTAGNEALLAGQLELALGRFQDARRQAAARGDEALEATLAEKCGEISRYMTRLAHERIQKERIEKLKRLLRVSVRLKQAQMRRVLAMDEEEFDEKIFAWADEFGFVIDGDDVIIKRDNVSEFIALLEREFASWTESEGKIE